NSQIAMPRRSDRQLLIRDLHRAIKYSWIMELVEPASEGTTRYLRGLQDDLLSTLSLVTPTIVDSANHRAKVEQHLRRMEMTLKKEEVDGKKQEMAAELQLDERRFALEKDWKEMEAENRRKELELQQRQLEAQKEHQQKQLEAQKEHQQKQLEIEKEKIRSGLLQSYLASGKTPEEISKYKELLL
ncbi:hypothetical protein HDV05_006294, partial [Chytridiales sp. JEL 0842]